ncbi:MAG: SHOCT domain-containing protein [Candidatus Thermoplasmatota archaeon]|nr:SHOCT domain-containing protein [Candidatus Thermoplasmatota archaeon]
MKDIIYKFLWLIVEDENPIKILKARYAKGEKTKEQFEKTKKTLSINPFLLVNSCSLPDGSIIFSTLVCYHNNLEVRGSG